MIREACCPEGDLQIYQVLAQAYKVSLRFAAFFPLLLSETGDASLVAAHFLLEQVC